MAIFAVLSLVVIFTVLGIGAITLAQRDNASSGSMLDIKSKESAAYAGLVYALGEFQRDPNNFVDHILKPWQTGSGTYWLKFNPGGLVTLASSNPGKFTPPGSTAQIVVQIAGVYVPPDASSLPVIALKSTGTGRSGDDQTLIGVYQIQNIHYHTPTVNLGITHPLYVSTSGLFDKSLSINGGDAYFGGGPGVLTHMNSTATNLNITNGGLRIYGDFSWDQGVALNVAGNSYISGNMLVKSGGETFAKNLIVGGGMSWSSPAPVTVNGALIVAGAAGISNLNGGTLNVGTTGTPAELYVPAGPIQDQTGGAVVTVKGSAYLHQLANPINKTYTLNVSNRLELADNAGTTQSFTSGGTSTWGTLVARSMAPGSTIVPTTNLGIVINNNSWVETPANLTLGFPAGPWTKYVSLASGKRLFTNGPCAQCYVSGIQSTSPLPSGSGISTSNSGGVNGQGFDAAYPPSSAAYLATASAASPAVENEVGVNLGLDPTIQNNKAWTATGSSLCNNGRICGASINKARTDDIAAGSTHFYNGFFVVKLDGTVTWDWDLGNLQTTPLKGKYLFIVTGGSMGASQNWPTTAPGGTVQSNPPDNVMFIDVQPSGQIFAGFCPRWKNDHTTPVVFYGFVHEDADPTTTYKMDIQCPLTIQGAVHVVGPLPGGGFQFNYIPGASATINLDQSVLTVIGNAFGSVFTLPGQPTTPFVPAGLAGFAPTENWIQFRPLGELR